MQGFFLRRWGFIHARWPAASFVAQKAIRERLMPASPSSFASVKLPSRLVTQAREVATPMRRLVAGQMDYWATLGRIAELAGWTVSEAGEALRLYEARQCAAAQAG
jgi:hypothetical protein